MLFASNKASKKKPHYKIAWSESTYKAINIKPIVKNQCYLIGESKVSLQKEVSSAQRARLQEPDGMTETNITLLQSQFLK